MSLLAELKRRNVIKMSAAYLALGWLLVEVATTVGPLLELPEWLPRVCLWILIIGFPLVVVMSWFYELTPEGLRQERKNGPDSVRDRRPARTLNYLTFTLVALAIALFAYSRFGPGHDPATAGPEDSGAYSPADAVLERPAIAVLPFVNLSSDPEQAYFADGLAEDLITRLSSWRAFPVIARNSSFQYRGGDVDLARASEALRARYIVEGSVRSDKERIRVNAQLIDAETGGQVWSDSYDSRVADVFSVQDTISDRIAASLVSDLNRAEANRAQKRSTDNLEAWSLYQLGLRQATDQFNRESFAAARRFYTSAAERDPQFATPLAQLVFLDLWEVVMGWSETPYETISAALNTARHAVEIDPRDPAAQAALGWAYVMSGDIDNGLNASRIAVDINPSMPEAWGWLSWNLLVAGDPEGSIAAGERAIRLNPLGPFISIIQDNFSQAYWELGDYEAGLRAARRLLAELPDYYFGHVYVAMNAVGLGRLDEAGEAIAKARSANPELSLELVQGMYGVERPAVDERRNAALRKAGLE